MRKGATMKRRIAITLLLMLAVSSALAETARIALPELRRQAPQRWTETYEAHGRSIQVDVPIDLPLADAVPVLRVKVAPHPSPAALKPYANKTETSADGKREYLTESQPFGSSMLVAIRRPMLKEPLGKSYPVKMQAETLPLGSWDPSRAYLPGNPLTILEAEQQLTAAYAALFKQSTPLSLREVQVQDVYLEGLEADEGYHQWMYMLEFTQVFHGIPILHQAIHGTLRGANGKESKWDHLSQVLCHISAKDSYMLQFGTLREADILADDLRLAPFDAVKASLEALIRAGRLRRVESLSLGYLMHPDFERGTQHFLLFPHWMLRGDIYEDGMAEAVASTWDPRWSTVHSSVFGDYPPRRSIFLNAQTGEVMDPFRPFDDGLWSAMPEMLP